jgi:hypothetical protein
MSRQMPEAIAACVGVRLEIKKIATTTAAINPRRFKGISHHPSPCFWSLFWVVY